MEFKKIRKYVNDSAKAKLTANWPLAISFLLLLMVVNLFFSIISQMLMTITNTNFLNPAFNPIVTSTSVAITVYIYILSQVVMIPLCLGVKSWFMKIGNISGASQHAIKAFIYFSSPKEYIRAIAIRLAISLNILVAFLVFLAPSYAINIIMKISWRRPNQVLDFMYFCFAFLCMALFVLGFTLAVIYCLNLFMAEYLFIRFDNIKILTAIKCSRKLVKSRKKEIALLFLINLPRILSCVFIIPIIFVVPYIKKMYAEYALGVINEKYEYLTNEINKTKKMRS